MHHTTRYRYDRLVNLGPQVVRLRPAPHCRTPILAYSMTVEPAQHFINWQQDPFSNYLARLVFPERTEHFEITIDLVAEMSVYNPFDFFLEASAEQYPFSYDDALKTELAPYLACDPQTSAAPLFRAYVEGVDRTPAGTVNFLVALNQQLQRDIGYLVRMEPGVQTPEQTLELASGSCRDSAWLLVQLCRHLGIAARFVSGYLIQLTPDVKSLDGPSGTSVDFTDLHAWCEVYLPGAGWIGFDPTSGLLAGEGHIPLACTPQPTSAAPVEGLIDECEVSFEHEMTVTRVYESPRVTKPYTDSQWDAVLALGSQVDGALEVGDVRLTQGGEPTFVSIDDRDGAEWNTDALGPTKRGYATELVQRLRAEYGDGGFLHFGQGKWYPGEQLPRWALSIFWRADGQPVWHDPSLFADEREPSAYTTDDAKRFIDALAARLNLTGEFIRPGYEDVWYYLWRERRLPVNVDPFDSRLDDELERARLRKVFEQQLDSVVGYVLPVKRVDTAPGLDGPRWQTGPWFFRDERMYLVPGDSPMGYRLPLDSLPWASRADYPYLVERDPFAPRDALPEAAAIRARYAGPADAPRYLSGVHREASAQTVMQWRDDGAAGNGRPAARDPGRVPERFESAAWITRTALCVEVRNGILYLFMPPLAALEDYLDLLGAIELTAHALGVKLVLEGYPPPRDARLKLLQVTPDPGVIEVNIHPAANFDELVDHTEFLYDAAWQSRLCSEKFMVDGRHVGTGGGNHFVLGGATPADSPFLRRPDLLASLIAYWHNHPSLSYLFSGLFIGPTSQAPRVDEARNDQLYELDIAFAEIQRNKLLFGQDMPPWLVDRVLRNLLIDVTGNTHRSEFCIDKLYSPDSSTGRLGLLELRAFEMPPHARMSIVQQLLLRALVARFWAAPYTTPLTRWGTALHDRFMLPEFLQMDFDDVLAELRDAGFAFDPAWFAPHFEFRFPLFGQIAVNGMQLSLRGALEPWHVMGEEGAPGGTVRYVDSSVERLEVRVTGLNDNRHVVTVNGRALPLQPTGTVGEYVAGVRYKAWSPPSALHPTIGVHAPLTFDIVDTWLQRSLGGCRYHVAHPGGRNYATFPVNAYEAESRRLARFVEMGHTPGRMEVAPAAPSREFPFTLDLRRP
ncbi:transglutaminase family protein [Burkholderia cepacia]|uniref:transglutaminase family protein n=1 Tax=Burkholderia cepacia TaxID=292 RepID=UPI0015FF2250|nr:transglutaminase family protein [Burkholderia cepacia]MBB0016672.1 transglutaminase family protein [Burkholderia cepacia]MBX3967828.1 transglutaminase family protein [Burkholderia cepacia]